MFLKAPFMPAFLAIAAGMLLTGPFGTAPARAEEVLKAASNLPTNVIDARNFIAYTERVNEVGKGKVRIEMLGGPEVIPTNKQGDALASGVLDMNFGIASFYKSKVPQADAMVGGSINAIQSRALGHTAYLEKIWRDKLNAQFLGWFNSGNGWHVYLAGEPKRTASGGIDFSGLKFRTSGSTREFVQAIGAIPAVIHANETYTALERNVVQGQVFPATGLTDYGWEKFLKYRIDPSVLQVNCMVMVNLDRWNKLPKDVQEILQKVAIEFESKTIEIMNAEKSKEWERQKAAGMKIIELPAEEAKKYVDVARATYWKRLEETLPNEVAELKRRFNP